MTRENNWVKVIRIHQFLPFIYDCHAMRRERKSEGWDEPSNQRNARNLADTGDLLDKP